MTYRITPHSDELCHYGVLGMRWGVRRYQNYDGTRIGTGGTPVINKAKTAEGSVKKLKGTMDKAFNNTVPGGQGGKAKGNAKLAAIANPKIGKTLKNAKFAAAAGEVKSNSSKEKDNSKDNSQQIKNDVRGAKNDANSLTEASKKLTNIGKKHDPKIKQVGEKASRDAKKMSDQELRETINRIKMEREYQSLKESEVSSGWDKANDILDIVGTVVLIAGNIASLYLAYKSLKHDDADIPYAEAELYNYMIENNFDEEVIQHFIDMDDEYVDDFLEHYGVLGMKWGVRRYQNYDGTRIATGSGTGGGAGGALKRTGYAMSKSQQMNANIIRPEKSSSNNKINSVKDVLTDPSKLAASSTPRYHGTPHNSKGRKDNVKVRANEAEKVYDRMSKAWDSPANKREIELRGKLDENDLKWFELQDRLFEEPNDDTPKAQEIIKEMKTLDAKHKKIEKALTSLNTNEVSRAQKEYRNKKSALQKEYSNLHYKDLDEDMIELGQKWGLEHELLSRSWDKETGNLTLTKKDRKQLLAWR